METTATKTRSTRKPYDPGKPGTITAEGNGRFIVESFKKPGEHYSVDLNEKTCTCPQHLHRIAPKVEAGETPEPCKHQEAAEDLSFWMAIGVARQLSTPNLRFQMSRTDLRPEILEAVRIVYHFRAEVEEAFETAAIAEADTLATAA